MSRRRQITILREGSLAGPALHSGIETRVTFRPVPENTGIRYYKNGRAAASVLVDSRRCTALGTGDGVIRTVEHAAAAIAGLGIDNLDVLVEGDEMPAMDGSAAPFAEFLQSLGLAEQAAPARTRTLASPIFVQEGISALLALPAGEFSVSYVLDYPDEPALRGQKFEFGPGVDFLTELAPARTFCTKKEAEALREQGLGLGATRKNTLVMGEAGPEGTALRFPDECARHKALDLLGDLSFTGFRFTARVIALRGGHSLNRKMVERIQSEAVE